MENEIKYEKSKLHLQKKKEIYGFNFVYYDKYSKKKILKRIRSHLAISWAYQLNKDNWEIKGWAFLPNIPDITNEVTNIINDVSMWNNLLKVKGKDVN